MVKCQVINEGHKKIIAKNVGLDPINFSLKI